MLLLILLCFVPCFASDLEIPCLEDEFPCDKGGCIHKGLWCDGEIDCKDGSDEAFCSADSQCEIHHFKCYNGPCIPWNGVCDNVYTCKDGSDEENCGKSNNEISRHNDYEAEVLPVTSLHDVLKKAATYILSLRQLDYSWGPETPRAVVALSFVDDIINMSEDEKELMKNRLNIQLSMELLKNSTGKRMSTCRLALYINALVATCQDPHNFQGGDLVALLREDADCAMLDPNFKLPLVPLTLCITGAAKYNDFRKLVNIYNHNGKKLDSIAITMMAMSCVAKQVSRTPDFETYRNHFVQTIEDLNHMDIYTKALMIQARNALHYSYGLPELVSHQNSDGSFGDLLATYYTIPALMNKSLSDLRNKCNLRYVDDGICLENSLQKSVATVRYSLYIDNGDDTTTHFRNILFAGNKTLYDLMKMAKARDNVYRFRVDNTSNGKQVYSLAGIPNDAEKGKSWHLYSTPYGKMSLNKNNLSPLKVGVDRIIPRNNDHYIFWFESDLM